MSSSPSLQNDALQRLEKFVEPPSAERYELRELFRSEFTCLIAAQASPERFLDASL